MQRKTPLVSGETYHIYNRGAYKLNTFGNVSDFSRFLMLLFLANHKDRVHMSNTLSKYKGRSFIEVYADEKPDKSLVDVLAFCLLPNHFHLLLRQKTDEGISMFMKKVMTGYSMYRNVKYEHSGVVFQGRFKSSHVDNEAYFRYIFSYIHLNPISLKEKEWEERGIKSKGRARDFVRNYKHSSYVDYHVGERPESNILSLSEAPDFLKTDDFEEMLLSIKDRPL